MRIRSAALPMVAVLLWLLVLAAYWPGLRGGFLFDDYGSLPALGAQGPIDHWAIFCRYITSGTADPTGRPLAMLTFLLDAHNWPADPFPFKRTNLIIHLINGALLYVLLSKLSILFTIDTHRARLAALLGCALWLLSPLLVSTTLYIVQREAMLAATCVMAGLLAWLHGRKKFMEKRLKAGAAWSMLGMGGFTLLGMLAKANGVLLPLYTLLIEVIVLIPRQPIPIGTARRTHQIALATFCIIPAVALLGYVVWIGIQGVWVGGPVGVRSWSIGQRLLTEPRVLMDYLQLLWLPRPFSSGLFNDQYIISTSLLHPAATLPALLAVITLIGTAWWQRRRHPALALALLFYFAGQLLESSSIALELYFEHRNYGPALLMFWPLGLWLTNTRSLRAVKVTLMIALPLTLAGMTRARADVWGNVRAQGLVWARINPDSPRAQANAAEIEMRNGRSQLAAHQLRTLITAQPDQAQLAFNLIDADCLSGHVNAADLHLAHTAMLHTANTGTLSTRWFLAVLPSAIAGRCRGLTPAALRTFIEAGLKNPKLKAAGSQQDLIYLRGRIALAEHRPDTALSDFTQAIDLQVRPAFVLKAAAMLGSEGYPTQGLLLLDHYCKLQKRALAPAFGMPMLHAWVLRRQHYWVRELARMRDTLTEQVHKRATPATSPTMLLPDEPGRQ